MIEDIFLMAILTLITLIMVAIIRLAISKNLPEKVVVLDTINTIIITTMILLSAAFKTLIYIDVAIAYALLSFIGTLYISRYLGEKQW